MGEFAIGQLFRDADLCDFGDYGFRNPPILWDEGSDKFIDFRMIFAEELSHGVEFQG